MTPGGFDIKSAKEVIGDERLRIVEGLARTDADAADLANPFASARLITENVTTYWDGVRQECARVVYHNAFIMRIARRERKAGKE